MDIWLNDSGRAIAATDKNTLYRLVLVLLLIGGLGNVAAILSKKPALAPEQNRTGEEKDEQIIGDRLQPAVKIFAIVLSVLVLLAFLRFNGKYFQAQARYLYPAVAPIALCLGLGFWRLTRQRLVPALAVIVLVLGGTTFMAGSKLKEEFAKRTITPISQKEPVVPNVTSVEGPRVIKTA